MVVKQRAKPVDDPITSVPMTLPVLRDLERLPDPPPLQALGPHTEVVFNAICSGWSNGMIVAHLRENYDTTPPLDLIQEYRELVPLDRILPTTEMDAHFRGLRVMVDPLVEMQKILRIEQERLSTAWHVEKLADEGFNPQVDARLRTHWKHLKEFAELTQRESGGIPAEGEPETLLFGDLFVVKATATRTHVQVEINAPESERPELDTGVRPAPLLERGTG